MKILPKNEAILKQRFPETLKRIYASRSPLRAAEIQYADDNSPVLSLEIAGQKVHPYGKSSPNSLLESWKEALTPCSNTVYFMGGFGLGTHVQILLNQLPEDPHLFVWEEDPHLLGTVLGRLDLSEIMGNEKFLIGTGMPDAACFQPIEGIHFSGKSSPQRLFYGPLQALNPIMELQAWKQFQEQYRFWETHYTASLQDGTLLQETVFQNLPMLLQAPDVSCTKNMFSGLPLVLVGAGPSLDTSLDFIRQVKSHALIVCANSAYRSLRNAGIVPHITVAIDPREDTAKGYQGVSTEGTFLVCSSFINSKILKQFSDHFFSWTGQSALARAARIRLGLGEGTKILEQGTVSASIVDLAHFWGCSKVCLVAQDMAFSTTGQTHTADSFYSDEGRLLDSLDQCIWVPGNTGGEVPTSSSLFTYLKTFENIVHDYPNIDFINIAPQGAAIEGVPYRDQKTALEWIGDLSTEMARGQLRALADGHRAPSPEDIKTCLSATKDFAKRVLQTSLEAALHCELMPERMRERSYERNPVFRTSDQHATTLNRLLDRYPRDYEILFEGRTRAELARYQASLPALNKDTSAWGRSRANKEFFWSIAEGTQTLLDTLN